MQAGMFAEVGSTLRILREAAGLTQAEVARRSGLGKSQISKYESGKELPKLASLEKLLRVVGADPLTLFYTAHLLRRFCDVLSALICEADRVMPKSPEGWYRTQVRAALADLRFLQGYLTEKADERAWNLPAGDEALARMVRRKVQALGKIADAIEGALAVPSEP